MTWVPASTAGIIGLNEAILRLHDAAFRIGEVALRPWIGLLRCGPRLPGFLRPSLDAAVPFSFDPTLSPAACRASPPALHCLLDLRSASACRQPDPASRRRACLCESLVLLGIRRLGGRSMRATSLSIPLAFLHALITHRFVFRRIRLIFCHPAPHAEFDQPAVSHSFRTCRTAHRAPSNAAAEVADVRSPAIQLHNHHKIVRRGSLAIRRDEYSHSHSRAAEAHHHARVKRRLPEPTHIAAVISLRSSSPHQFNDKPRHMPSARSPAQSAAEAASDRYSRAEILAHSQRLNQTRQN